MLDAPQTKTIHEASEVTQRQRILFVATPTQDLVQLHTRRQPAPTLAPTGDANRALEVSWALAPPRSVPTAPRGGQSRRGVG